MNNRLISRRYPLVSGTMADAAAAALSMTPLSIEREQKWLEALILNVSLTISTTGGTALGTATEASLLGFANLAKDIRLTINDTTVRDVIRTNGAAVRRAWAPRDGGAGRAPAAVALCGTDPPPFPLQSPAPLERIEPFGQHGFEPLAPPNCSLASQTAWSTRPPLGRSAGAAWRAGGGSTAAGRLCEGSAGGAKLVGEARLVRPGRRARPARWADRLRVGACATTNLSQRIVGRPAPITFNLSQLGTMSGATCCCPRRGGQVTSRRVRIHSRFAHV